jgi:hypothetical protein
VRSIFAAITVAILTTSAGAAEKPVHLKSGPGLDKVEANCSGCHSLDYVPMNSPFLNAAGWDSEVAKMINAFGAPIDAGDAKIHCRLSEEELWTRTHANAPSERTNRRRSIAPKWARHFSALSPE